MKSHLELWLAVAENISHQSGISTTRDYETVARRTNNEGYAFLGIVLPQFGKDFERCLELEYVAPELFPGFGRDSDGLPRFLSGFLERVFDRSTLRIAETPDPSSVYAIRQLTLLFSKVETAYSEELEKAAMDQFVSVDEEVQGWTENIFNPFLLRGHEDADFDLIMGLFRKFSSILFGNVFAAVSREIDGFELLPKHGPGATADRLVGNNKWDQIEWTQRLEQVFPTSEYLIPSHRYHEYLDRVHILDPEQERPVRVITVPKTMKGPRIIAIEPTCMQYMQQGLLNSIVRNFDASSYASKFISFDSQTENRTLAAIGSDVGSLATLDLSEASDRVPHSLVSYMLAPWSPLQEAVEACRSTRADVLGQTIRLSKFASMGSALTFPIESMVFTTLVFVGIALRNPDVSLHDLIRDHYGKVRVFGDDIICPSEYAESVIFTMEEFFPLKVNKSKSFWNGQFRESCGKEFFMGCDVSVVKARHSLPRSRSDVQEIVSLVSFRNQAYLLGLWRAASQVDDFIVKFLGEDRYPVIPVNPTGDAGSTSPAIGRVSFLPYQVDRINPFTHGPEVRAWVAKAKKRKNALDDIQALHKCLSTMGEEPTEDTEHLKYSGRPVAVSLKQRWVPSY